MKINHLFLKMAHVYQNNLCRNILKINFKRTESTKNAALNNQFNAAFSKLKYG